MPIFVQWKWQEKTNSFLVIFHLYDDYSRTNLRLIKKTLSDGESEWERSTITWAPSHLELGLLNELLCYANIVNGFKEVKKRELRKDLEIAVDEGKEHATLCWKSIDNLLESGNRLMMFETPFVGWITKRPERVQAYVQMKEGKDSFFCAELCPEYIEYLKKAMSRYLT